MYAAGDFSFMKDESSEEMLTDMYNAVSVSENWENLKGFVPEDGGFMFSKMPEWFSLINKAVKYDGHSGSSHGWTMRCIDYIAKHGWDNFVAKMTQPDDATRKRLRILELPYCIQEAKNRAESWKRRVGVSDLQEQAYMSNYNDELHAIKKLEAELEELRPSRS